MVKPSINIQDAFLNAARKEKIKVTVFSRDQTLKGIVRSFDNFTILFDAEGKQYLIYKHAVSAIMPDKNIDFQIQSGNEK